MKAGISQGISEDWPEGLAEAAAQFRLGDLISDPPIHFYGLAGNALWTPEDGNRPNEDGIVSDIECPYGIITTQTCDVGDPSNTRPFIQVSPVYRSDDEKLHARRDVILLSSPSLPEGQWVADLRIEVPVEKSILIGRERIAGFSSENDEIEFAGLLGRRRDRAALHDVINDVLYASWNKKRANNKPRAREVFGRLHCVGLTIEGGTRLEPVAVQCHFVGKAGPVDEGERDWLEAWWDRAREDAASASPPLELWPNAFYDGKKMDLEVYDKFIILNGWLRS